MSSQIVLDASSVLALLGKENGYLIVEEALPFSVISSVNLSEVISKITARGVKKDTALQMISILGIKVMPFEEEDAYACGFLYPETKKLGFSLEDRACIALGLKLKKTVLTADSVWKDLKPPIEIRLIS
jgi:ribonuclease VapC